MEKYFEYLDELRESGNMNMFGAGQALRMDFGLDKKEAADILSKWMETFDGESSVAERVAKVA